MLKFGWEVGCEATWSALIGVCVPSQTMEVCTRLLEAELWNSK